MNELLIKVLEFIERRESLYFRTITVLIIIVLFLAAERFQDVVLFVSIGLLIGGVYYRRKGDLVDIGTMIGAGVGLIFYFIYFLLKAGASFL